MGTLWNTYAFYVLYADIDKFDPSKYELEYSKLSELDKWILSKLNTLVKTVDENLANYRITEAGRAAQDFIDELSNWYVRRSRERFWQSGMPQDKINAYMTLYTVLSTVCKTMAPFIPYMTEEIYQNIERPFFNGAPLSVHLCDFPKFDETKINSISSSSLLLILSSSNLGKSHK
jgi:isoleucyl-tRNA synthetase